MIQNKPLIFLMGPTASGKTGLSIQIAQRFNLEIVNTDSVQIYQEFSIGAAKPTQAEQSQAVHHLLDVVSAREVFSADRYRQAAWEQIEACHLRQIVPLFVGGSGLYFRAVEQGLACMPPMDLTVREEIRLRGEQLGWPVLHEQLRQIDPELATRLPLNDSQRICHGLTVHQVTGKTLTEWHRLQPPPPPFTILKMALNWPREILNERINQRFDLMINSGFLEEAAAVMELFSRDHPAMKAVGYRQIFAYLDGDLSLDKAVEWAKQESRRYAKRQMTWLRRESGLIWIPWDEPEIAINEVKVFLQDNDSRL
ncbi:MAG: tRNA (adenosine(37)-N6)-dimethylallyltransferase MiaA [Magnetococcales bacterium]|nr:tRNA (adenosine(37)-N6)-dimethylallyltransferase MiaA [Magnetococcales bacterium]